MRALSPQNECIIPAKNGNSFQAGTILLHSRYDPLLEAQKYIDSLDLKPYHIFILIEPGLGYLATTLQKTFPLSKIITLHCTDFFRNHNLTNENLSWDPDSNVLLEIFLENILADTDAAKIRLIDWKPSINAYGKACLDLTARTVECIRRISAGRKTVRNFGRRWLRNALRNLELFSPGIIYQGSAQVIVCSAGPSLEDSFDDIVRWRQNPSPPLLIAVSSAAPALLSNGINPDIIIAADGGSWALSHLTECSRYFNDNIILTASLTAAIPSQAAQLKIVLLRDGSMWQELLLKKTGISSLVFPQRGTVSACALDLAFFISTGNVYVAGLDFAHRDLLTHCRPYAFESLLEKKATRRQPMYSQIFEREETIRNSGSHGIYAAWFKTYLNSFPKRLFSLGYSNLGIPQGKPTENKTDKKLKVTAQLPKTKVSKNILLKTLTDALENPLLSATIVKELGELLIPGDSDAEAEKHTVKEALMELWNKNGTNYG